MNLARAEIVQHIDNLNQLICDALNRRDFDPEAPIWDLWSPNFHAYVDGTGLPDREDVGVPLAFTGGKYKVLRFMKQATMLCPELWYRLIQSNTKLNDARNKAVSFLILEITGNPAGVKRLAITIAVWQLDDRRGKWLNVSAQSMGGIDQTPDMMAAVL